MGLARRGVGGPCQAVAHGVGHPPTDFRCLASRTLFHVLVLGQTIHFVTPSYSAAKIHTPAVAPLGSSEHGSFFRFQRLLLVVWRDVPNVADIEEMSAVAMRLKEEGPFAVVQQLAPSSRMPDAETRSKILSTWLRVGHDLIAMDMVLLDQGFWASAARSVINGMIIASRQRAPIRVSTNVGEHSAWLLSRMSKRLGHGPTQAELFSAVDQAKRAAQGA